jgi:N-carbamoyl-L-amino-acid hydrolase
MVDLTEKQSDTARTAACALAMAQAVLGQERLARSLFDELRAKTSRGKGIFRDAYGDGENLAHRLVAAPAQQLGLKIEHDAAANTYMTMRGQDRSAPRIVIGSHLDSVADGGNFDGAAGVVAGLLALAALETAGFRPTCDITVMAIRAEESVWFTTTFFGSRAALGKLAPQDLGNLRRVDTGRTLAEHLASSGGDWRALSTGEPHLDPSAIRAYLEVHIEQGPVLESEKLSVGLVTGIRGNYRRPAAKIRGAYSHCGGVPRNCRRDTVIAISDFIQALDRLWEQWERDGNDMAFTVGKLFTDSARHALTKIPGEVTFSLDVRSVDPDRLSELEERVEAIAAEVAERRGVAFELGPVTRADVGRVDPAILAELTDGAKCLGIPTRQIVSGASHDAATFAQAGIPMGMIFVRNANGSHNPDEDMRIEDLLAATRLLTWWLVTRCSA